MKINGVKASKMESTSNVNDLQKLYVDEAQILQAQVKEQMKNE